MMNDEIMKRIDNGIQYRNLVEIRAKDPEPEGEDAKVVEGYASTFNEPYTLYDDGSYRIDEQVDPHAFDECDMADVIMQYNHEGRVFARTRNKTLEVVPDEAGLFIRANLGGTDLGRQIYDEIKGGYSDRMSFGFTVEEDKREETYNRETDSVFILRTITKVGRLYDVSAVSIPANDGTSISARSFCDGIIAEIKAEAEKRARIENARAEALELLKEVNND